MIRDLINKKSIKIQIFFVIISSFLINTAYAEFGFERNYPLDNKVMVTANFGQFRIYTKPINGKQEIYYVGIHEGIDLPEVTGTNVYPVAAGEIKNAGWSGGFGNRIIVKHNNSAPYYETLYAHLSYIDDLDGINRALDRGMPYEVRINDPIGKVGSTGNSTGPHLHFQVGSQATGGYQENPIVAGLGQPWRDDAEAKIKEYPEATYYSNSYIRLLGQGNNGKFDMVKYIENGDYYQEIIEPGDNEEINYVEPGQPVKIVVEAYQNADDIKYKTNPYGIEFVISEIGGFDSPPVYRRFNKKLSELNASLEDYYNFAKPWVTKSFSGRDYYYIDWTPDEGIYKIQVKVYSTYRENGILRFQDPPGVRERIVTVGLAGIDFTAPLGYSFAQYNPNEAKVRLAGVPTVRVSTAGEYPEIYYNDLSRARFSINPGDATFPRKTNISARADRNVEWTVRIKNEAGSEVATLTGTGDRLSREWGGGGDGTYTYQVEAKDPASGKIAVDQGVASIKVDNNPPTINLRSDPTIYILTNEAKAILKFTSNEDLYSCRVDALDVCGSPLIDALAVGSGMKTGEELDATWENPGSYPNGWYYLKATLTDYAGNQTIRTVPVQVNLPGQTTPTENPPGDPILRVTPPEDIKNLKIGDIALDDLGNIYVVYTNKLKIVKYDNSGKEIGEIEGFKLGTQESSTLWYPLGIAVSSSGDRIYVADTYNNRVLIYNKNLQPVKEIKGKDVYMTYGDVDSYEWTLFWKSADRSRDAGGGEKKDDYEGYDLPVGVALSNGNFFVVDENKHRLLKYDLDGDPAIFPILKADLRSEARAAFNQNYTVSGQTVERAKFYSNSLNDLIVFDPYSIGRYSMWEEEWEKHWIKVMFNHSNPSGSADGQFASPFDTAVDSCGNIYVLDAGNHRIQKFAPDGVFISRFGEGNLNSPKGIDIDDYGNTWVADTGNQRIAQFDPLSTFVNEYQSDGYNIDPQKIVVRGGKIYIADANSSRPLVWNVAGEISNVRVSNHGWFSPNGDGQEDNLKVSYNISQPADIMIQAVPKSSGDIDMMETGGVVALDKAARSIGRNEEVWDGTIQVVETDAQSTDGEEQNVIADGQYDLMVTASFGDYMKTESLDLNVDTENPTVALNRAPPAISPNGDNVLDRMQIDYSVSDNLSPTSEVKILLLKNDQVVDVLSDSHYALPVTRYLDWGGEIGEYVMEGNYILELKATDLAGNISTATAEVLVDRQPPRIEAVAFSNSYFSPNGDEKKDSTEISFSLYDTYADKMLVTASIVDENGDAVAKLIDGQELEAGEQILTWEGTSIPGSLETLVSDGVYKVKICAEDSAGNTGTCEPVTVVVDTVPPEVIDLAADPNPFTPNNDGINDRADFSYVFSEPCNAELRILRDDGATLFRDHRHYDIENGNFSWDGTGFHGEILGEEHPYYLYAEDRAGNFTVSETQLIVVDHMPSLVPYAYADPDPFSPVNPNNGFTDINYYLSRDGLVVTAEVIGREGRVVKSLLNGEVQGKGEHSIRWYGDFASSYDGPRVEDKVADGSWEFRISATATDGSAPCDTTNTVLVDNIPPHIMVAPVELDRVNRTATLKYSVPETVSMEVALLNNDDELLSMLESSNAKFAGDYTVTYDFSGEPEETTGNRYFKLVAVDRAKNIAEKLTEVFAVNPDALQVTGHQVVPSTFTPNGDGLTDLTQLRYSVSGGVPDYNVNIDIQTQTGSTIKDLLENDPQAPGMYFFYWDGKTNSSTSLGTGSGQLTPDGYYDYVITVEDKLGTRVEERGTMLLVSTRPTIDISTGYPIFSPNGDGLKDSIMLNYEVDYAVTYITGEALVELQVLNASGEAVWSKIFSHTPGTYAYEYNGDMNGGGKLPAGNYYVKALAQDALGSTAVPKTVDLAVDYTVPEPTDFAIEPAYAKLATDVRINLEFGEELAGDPTVTLTLSDDTIRIAELVSSSGNTYEFNYIVGGEDAEGEVIVTAEAQDLAFNPIVRTKTFVIDKTDPQVSGLSIDPNPASIPSVGGQVSIRFDLSEALKEVPKVYVTQNGATPRSAVVSGSWSTGGPCEAKYDVFAGYDGPALITVEATDLANNLTTYQPNNLLEVDTIAPAFSDFQAEVASNPEHSDYAREGYEVTIRFQTSEDLQLNPEVRVNDNPAGYYGLIGPEYTYKYAVSSSDTNGNAVVSVSGLDLAGNEGIAETSSTSESFVIDLVNPEVIISEDPGMIANPSPFSTNASSETDPKQTTLYYGISENGYVAVGVHKIANDLTVYTRDDFNNDNLVISFDEGWKSQGDHHIYWDGAISGGGFADPGKYAFIVEVRDWAGNLIEGKWGGTCWIQNNVLDLVNPEQAVQSNPDPLYFSPNGDGSLDSTMIYFRVNLGITPAECATPEKISVLGALDDLKWLDGVIKKVGTYTIRVYDESKTTLLRTIVEDAPLSSNLVLSQTWDGKNDVGDYMPEGIYKIEIDARDYLGGQAMHNLLTLTATVDVTAPRIENHEPNLANTPWTNTGKNYDVDFFDDHNSYASKLKHAQYRVMTGANQTGNEKIGWTDVFADGLNASSYTTDWGSTIFDGLSPDGTYYVSVKVFDNAGNENLVNDVFYVKKDVNSPSIGGMRINDGNPYTTSRSVAISFINASDNTSGLNKIKLSNDKVNWSTEYDFGSVPWILPDSDGQKWVYAKVGDIAGNWTTYEIKDDITLDRQSPYVSGLPAAVDDNFNPYTEDTTTVNFTMYDLGGSGIYDCTARIKYDSNIVRDQNILFHDGGNNWHVVWDGKNNAGDHENEGDYILEIIVSDFAGNPATVRTSGIYLRDDVRISNSAANSSDPYLEINGDTLTLKWIEGWISPDENRPPVTAHAHAGALFGSDPNPGYSEEYFFANFPHSANVTTWANDGINSEHWVYDQFGNIVFHSGHRGVNQSLALNEGLYKVKAKAERAGVTGGDSETTVNYKYRWYNQYTSIGTNYGKTWSNDPGSDAIDKFASAESLAESTAPNKTDPGPDNYSNSETFTTGTGQYVNVCLSAFGNVYNGRRRFSIMNADTNQEVWAKGDEISGDLSENWFAVWLDPGTYYLRTRVCAVFTHIIYGIGWYTSTTNMKIWYVVSGSNVIGGHSVWASGNQIWYKGGQSPNIKITNSSGVARDPSLAVDGSGNFYVTWVDSRDGNDEIYFQKLPSNFARLIGTAQGASVVSDDTPIVSQPASFEAPSLIAPEDDADINSLRPTFTWKHHKLDAQEYKIDLAKNDTFTISSQTFDKSANTGSPDKDDPALYHYTYSIHEFDPGLDRDTYYWRVTALATSEAATSEVRSFTVAPELTLTSITNYPNPFNPNREATKIRYRLGATADEVKIRIYDVVGSLVKEIDNCPTEGELSSIWDKYHDVDWDGRNGRGDMVVNGIYPFEVIARLGDKSVSGRGKVAVLK